MPHTERNTGLQKWTKMGEGGRSEVPLRIGKFRSTTVCVGVDGLVNKLVPTISRTRAVTGLHTQRKRRPPHTEGGGGVHANAPQAKANRRIAKPSSTAILWQPNEPPGLGASNTTCRHREMSAHLTVWPLLAVYMCGLPSFL